MSSDRPRFDICVIGGSVAGSTAAATFAGMGYAVALIEREAAFRDKARGEGIHPWGVDEAEDLGLLEVLRDAGAQELPVWQTYLNREPLEPMRWADESARGHTELGVYHPALQQALLDRAQATGATIYRPAALVAIDQDDDHPTVLIEHDGEQISLDARFVIGADGTHSKTRSLAGIDINKHTLHHWFAGVLIDHFGGDEDAAHAALLPGGRFFILPQGKGRARLYAALMPAHIAAIQADRSGRALIDLVSSYLPEGMLADAHPVGPQGIYNNADLWPATGVADRIVLIGDAAGTNDPSIGNGISLAFRDVRELRDCVREFGLTRAALEQFAARRVQYYGTLRAFASWMAELWVEEGPEADARRLRFRTARETDPDAGGFNTITALGPRDLVASPAGRARFLGDVSVDRPSPG